MTMSRRRHTGVTGWIPRPLAWTLFILGTLLGSMYGAQSVLSNALGLALSPGRYEPRHTGLWETCFVTTLAAAGLLMIWLTQRRRAKLVVVLVLALIAGSVAAIWWIFTLLVTA